MANGLFGGGTGTLNDPYLIEDAFDLDAVRNNLTAHYKMIADIDLNISPFNEGEGWTPIGDNSTNNNNSRFTGVFDGNGFVIKNLFINRPSTNYQGLFGYTFGSSIKNIGVEDVNITGGSNTGGLVGRNSDSSVINSYSTGNVTGSGSYTGGLVGYNSDSSVINSYSTGNVTGSGSYTGGLVGYNDNSSIIKNSYSTGNVKGNRYTGGLVGYNSKSSVINSYSTGSVTGGSNTGGLVGYSYVSSVTNSYWDIETSGRTSSEGGVGKTTAEMQTPSTFIGWENETLEDGTHVWILQYGDYPKLWYQVTTNKTLILHDGEYKKISGGSYEKIEYLSIDPKSSETLVTATASSTVGVQYPEYAFNNITDETEESPNGWVGDGSTNQWLQAEFPTPISVGKYEIYLNAGAMGISNYPKDFRFEGSNNGTSWDILDTQTGITFDSNTKNREFPIDSSKIKDYKYYRIFIVASSGTYTKITELKMYQAIVIPPAPLSWETVSSTLPTSTQFLEHGMDDLSVLNRQVTELPPMQMEDKTNILFTNGEVGKVFSKTIDLKKYFDIRSLKVEGK